MYLVIYAKIYQYMPMKRTMKELVLQKARLGARRSTATSILQKAIKKRSATVHDGKDR